MPLFVDEMTALLKVGAQEIPTSIEEVGKSVSARFYSHIRPYHVGLANYPIAFTNFPEKWQKAYLDKKSFRADPVIVKGLSSNLVQWWSRQAVAEIRDPAGVKVMEERFSQGCSDGISIPVRGPSGQFSVLSFWTEAAEPFQGAVRKRFADLHAYAVHLHEAIYRHHDAASTHSLNDIEVECLKWTAMGKTAWEISVLLSLPERTVHYHLAESSRKLGAANKTAAVCIALKAGILEA